MVEKLNSGTRELEAGTMNRREFFQKTALLTGAATLVANLPEVIGSAKAYAAQVDPGDPALISSDIKFSSTDGGAVSAYLTRPKGEATRPAVVVIHPWSGIDDHTQDVGRRLAKAGYVALVPDLLSRLGGTSSFQTRETAIAAGQKLSDDMIAQDLAACVHYLKGQNFVRADKIGVIGFCWGGGKALMFTTRSKELAASVIYYGDSPKNVEDVKNIMAPVLAHYGELDERITSGVPKLEDAMKKYGKSFEYRIYPGAPHSFNTDTNPRSYRPEAAKEAWSRTLEFFKAHLQG